MMCVCTHLPRGRPARKTHDRPQPASAVRRPRQQQASVLRARRHRYRRQVHRLVRGNESVGRGLGGGAGAPPRRLEEGDSAAGTAEADVLVGRLGQHHGADAYSGDLFCSAVGCWLVVLLVMWCLMVVSSSSLMVILLVLFLVVVVVVVVAVLVSSVGDGEEHRNGEQGWGSDCCGLALHYTR